jgi:hypothetical protein
VSVPVSVGSEDVTGLAIVTLRPTDIAGTLVIDLPDPALRPEQFPLTAQTYPPLPMPGSSLMMEADGSFRIQVPGEGRVLLAQGGPWPKGWGIKSVLLGDVDVIRSGISLHPGERMDRLTVVVTNRFAKLVGSVADDHNAPVTGCHVLVFSDEPQHDVVPSSVDGMSQTGDDGRFQISGLRPGRYLAIALAESEVNLDRESLDKLRPDGVPFDVTDVETKTLNLKITRPR